MSATTTIEWTDRTWNPLRGCSRVSDGCRNCYAERVAWRFGSQPGRPYYGLVEKTSQGPRWTGRVQLLHDALDEPLRVETPARWFVNSMSDLFHEAVPESFILQALEVMANARTQTLQVLTKRPERMRDVLSRVVWLHGPPRVVSYGGSGARSHLIVHTPMMREQLEQLISEGALRVGEASVEPDPWPWPPNVWLGVSVEDQSTAASRIPPLLDTPAAVRFVSCEPLLGPVDISRWLRPRQYPNDDGYGGDHSPGWTTDLHTVDWCIVGGESGPRARPTDVAWLRGVVEQCKAADVPVFVKQLGAQPRGWCASRAHCDTADDAPLTEHHCDFYEAHEQVWPCPDRCAAMADNAGRDPAEWPADIRVREFPAHQPDAPATLRHESHRYVKPDASTTPRHGLKRQRRDR